jgi:hypothetical protein
MPEYPFSESLNEKVNRVLHNQLDELTKQIEYKKKIIDELDQQITKQEDQQKLFQEQYDQYIVKLDRKYHLLQREREILFRKINKLSNDPASVLKDESGESPDDNASSEEDNKQEELKSDVLSPSSEESLAERRKSLKTYFARVCRNALGVNPNSEDNEFLKTANAIIDSSHDEVEALIAIKWDKERWTKRAPNESMGDQLERLISWNVYLDEALNRLQETFTQSQADDQQAFWQEMERAKAEGRNYFEELATEKRSEIIRLERAIQVLRDEYEHLYREALEAFGKKDD